MRLVAFRKRIIIAKKREENRCIIIQVTSVENNLNESERNWNMPKKTRPRETNLYDIFCAILCLLKGGISWRMLPSDFQNWKLVYVYFTIWSKLDETGKSFFD